MNFKKIVTSLALLSLTMTGCGITGQSKTNKPSLKVTEQEFSKNKSYAKKDFDYKVDPETFQLSLTTNGKTEIVAQPQQPRKIADYQETASEISWSYPDEHVEITLKKEKDHLAVKILNQAKKENTFSWPKIDAENYTLPIAEGKSIPNNQPEWLKYFLGNNEIDLLEAFSMSFFSINQPNFATTFVLDNTFNSQMTAATEPHLSFETSHTFVGFDPNKTLNYRIYLTDNDPVAIAKTYQKDRVTLDKFKTLEQKAQENPEINKMNGALQIYFWNNRLLTSDDVKWQALAAKIDEPIFKWIGELLAKYGEDGDEEYQSILPAIKAGEAYKYEQNVFLNSLNYVLLYPEFYNSEIFTKPDEVASKLIEKGVDKLTEQERYTLNQHLMAGTLGTDVTKPLEQWGQKASTNVLTDMKKSEINKAWIGLPNWANGLMNPKMVAEANDKGYLVGPYDSYQSIQEDASIDWNTASFPNLTLYEDATITNKKGDKIPGFLGKGRKLNSTLIFPDVKERVTGILANNIPFNSWFLDTDAAGEIYNDYDPTHKTTQADDVDARLKRMNYLNSLGMVVGAETGNDFASEGMVYAHGLETPVIMWSDPDMRQNKESEYYVGDYAAVDGGIPSKYNKVVPIKDEYKPIYTDPLYSVPLYKLVYNRSVITSHHWEWDSYKIKGLTGQRRLQEYLYNTPPMVHLDQATWQDRKEDIVQNAKTWTPFQEKALQHEMTNFSYLSEDRLVQRTDFGAGLSVVANFSKTDFQLGKETIPPGTALIIEGNKTTLIDTRTVEK